MAAEGRVHVEAVADRGLPVERAVAVGVVQPVDAGRHADDQVAVVIQDAAEDVPGRIVR